MSSSASSNLTASDASKQPTVNILSTQLIKANTQDSKSSSPSSSSSEAGFDSSSSASQPPTQRVSLTSSDWILPHHSRIGLCFFYDIARWRVSEGGVNEKSNEEFMNIDRLTMSLQKMLKQIPILSGRFIPAPETGRCEIALSNEGVEFVTATSDITLVSLPLAPNQFTSTRVLPASLQLAAKVNYAAPPLGGPLLHIQHTRFACGSVCLGILMHHVVADGESYFGFIRDWSDVYRTENEPVVHPQSLDRSFAIISPEEVAQRLPGHKELGYVLAAPPTVIATTTTTTTTQSPAPVVPRVSISRVFRFSSAELKAMKEAATTEAYANEAQQNEQQWISIYEALTAHLHKMCYLARHPEFAASQIDVAEAAEKKVNLLLATNWRKRLQPAVPAHYFGNASLWTNVPLTGSQLAQNSLGANSLAIHTSLQERDSDSLRSTMAWITSQPNVSCFSKIAWAWKPQQDMFHSQWHKMHMYSSFHEGCTPTRVCVPHFPGMEGTMISMSVDPQCDDPDALDVALGLEESEMARLEANPEFRQFRPSV